jgi:hypothetical protein
MLLQPKSFVDPNTFYCRAYGRRLSIFKCMGDFVDANALKQKDNPCHMCHQGEENRKVFAKS